MKADSMARVTKDASVGIDSTSPSRDTSIEACVLLSSSFHVFSLSLHRIFVDDVW